jgi:hypothetical protein
VGDFSLARLRVPEPGVLALLAMTALGMGFMRRKSEA